jgi:hypothetical protein
MKIRRSILWFIVIIAMLIALVLWFGKKQPKEAQLAVSTETNALPPAATAQRQQVGTPSPATAGAPVAANMVAPATPDKGEQIKEGLAKLNDVPIEFYGKLEDQFGSPVAGAQIAASIRIYNGVQSTAERLTVLSDANGFFQVKSGNGESLGLWPRKEGYTLATTGTEFKYSYMYADHYTPDPNNPTVIKMWKLQGAEPLIGIDQRYKFHYTDAPVNIDLLTGKIVPIGGDIKITMSRSPGVVSERTLQDWSVQVEAVDGGLIETSAAESKVTYAAPEGGYQPNDAFIMSTSAPHKWFGGFDQTFFLQSRHGQVYSKVNFGISINQQPEDYVWVEFHGVANTNGSRNWEATASQ